MRHPFTKMHGLGNDFVVFDFSKQAFPISTEQAAHIANRNFGIGCDQILILERATRQGVDFKYRILNADGSEVGQCGNGARCIAKFVRDKGLADKTTFTVETLSGDMVLKIEPDSDQITVNMGIPNFSPSAIPLLADSELDEYTVDLTLKKTPQTVRFSAVSIGNPHAVIIVDDVNKAPVLKLGKQMEKLALFPARANIGFMQILDTTTFALRVFERGVGETIACGSGACAAAVAGLKRGLLDCANSNTVHASLRGGELLVSWPGEGHAVMMTGPAETVYEGEIEL